MAVVAGAILDGEGRLLMQQRPAGKRHAGQWEFPGGKVELGESPSAALIRELYEELRIVVAPEALAPLAFAEKPPDVPDPGIVILLYKIADFTGKPVSQEGAEVGWFTPAEIAELPLPPLDIDLVGTLCAMN